MKLPQYRLLKISASRKGTSIEAEWVDFVTCGECKYNENPCTNHGEMSPRCRYANYKRSADDFCSYGCRKEE